MKRLLALVCMVLLAVPAAASAVNNTTGSKGLSISPLRQYLQIDAGHAKTSSITIGNLTDKPLGIALSVKQFSVANYTYDYQFSNPQNNWLQLDQTQIVLAPGQSRKLLYTVAVPTGTAPGGHYYTLLASANITTGELKSTVQAAMPLYVTVNGTLIKTGHLQSSSIQRVVFGSNITYTLNPINTGNVHYFVYATGTLHGPLTKTVARTASHLLLPGAVRRMSGTISSPVLPGVYRASFGYKTDAGSSVMQSRYIVFIPPWFIALILIILLFASKFRRQHRNRKK